MKFHEERRLLVLDGGFGTTLEDTFQKDISTPLWSAKLVDDDPETVTNVHLAYLRAGADIILTSTYQCAYSTFKKAGYSEEEAVRLMRKAVDLAVEAKTRYLAECKAAYPEHIKIALSLGPFGATLSPSQEFDGYYPPPFGPREFDPTKQAATAFDDEDEERKAIEALTEFHLERLRVFKGDEETWKAIDYIAFETIPVTTEIKAIRKAVGILQSEEESGQKPWWISTVYPNGKFPEKHDADHHVPVANVVQTVIGRDGSVSGLPVPDGVGINCTSPEYLRLLVEEMGSEVKSLSVDGGRDGKRPIPWLVLYPNSGDVYDSATRRWTSHDTEESWAEDLGEVIYEIARGQTWPGIIAGGCCRTKPVDIFQLNRVVRRSVSKVLE